MAVNFTNDIQSAENQINQYIRKNQPVPSKAIEYYNTLVNATVNSTAFHSGGSSGNGGSTNDLPQGRTKSLTSFVPTSAITSLNEDTGRTYIIIQNIGDYTVYVNFGAIVSVNAGIQILPGGSWSSQIPQFIQSFITAISQGGQSTLFMLYLTTTPDAPVGGGNVD